MVASGRSGKYATQTQLGNVLGVTFQQVQKYERGTNRICTSALILIARALDISPAVLLGAEGEAAPAVDWSLLSEDGACEFVQALASIRSPKHRWIVFDLLSALAGVKLPPHG